MLTNVVGAEKVTLFGLSLSVLLSIKIQPAGTWHETGMFRKQFLFTQACLQLDRFVKFHHDKDATDKKPKLVFLQSSIMRSFSALEEQQQDLVHACPYFFFLE